MLSTLRSSHTSVARLAPAPTCTYTHPIYKHSPSTPATRSITTETSLNFPAKLSFTIFRSPSFVHYLSRISYDSDQTRFARRDSKHAELSFVASGYPRRYKWFMPSISSKTTIATRYSPFSTRWTMAQTSLIQHHMGDHHCNSWQLGIVSCGNQASTRNFEREACHYQFAWCK